MSRPDARHEGDDPWARLTVVFRTRSDIEASVVQALLESHGIDAMRTAGPPPGVFAFTTGPLGETRVSVRSEEAEEACA
jgi:hypothetical protein